MESKQSNYAAPVCAICTATNAGYLLGYGIRLFMLEDSVWVVTLLVGGIIWTVWIYYLWIRKLQIGKMLLVGQLSILSIPLFASIGLMIGIFF